MSDQSGAKILETYAAASAGADGSGRTLSLTGAEVEHGAGDGPCIIMLVCGSKLIDYWGKGAHFGRRSAQFIFRS